MIKYKYILNGNDIYTFFLLLLFAVVFAVNYTVDSMGLSVRLMYIFGFINLNTARFNRLANDKYINMYPTSRDELVRFSYIYFKAAAAVFIGMVLTAAAVIYAMTGRVPMFGKMTAELMITAAMMLFMSSVTVYTAFSFNSEKCLRAQRRVFYTVLVVIGAAALGSFITDVHIDLSALPCKIAAAVLFLVMLTAGHITVKAAAVNYKRRDLG